MAITKIGTKAISDGAITTVKLGSSAVTRADIQSGSVPGNSPRCKSRCRRTCRLYRWRLLHRW